MKTGTVVYVLAGMHLNPSGLRIYEWFELPEDLDLDRHVRPLLRDAPAESPEIREAVEPLDRLHFKRIKRVSTTPGSVYRFESPEPGRIYTNNPQPLGMLQDRELVQRWQATASANETEARARDAIRKGSRSTWTEILEPLREAYWSASPSARPQLLGLIVQFVTRRTR